MFTNEEIKALFNEMDTNHNGTIELNEFMVGFKKLFRKFSQGTMKNMFRMQDRNHDGHIDYTEFASLVKFLENDIYDDDPYMLLFDLHDRDANGVLTFNEFVLICRCISPKVEEDAIREFFNKADLSGDGAIDKREYLKIAPVLKEHVKDEE